MTKLELPESIRIARSLTDEAALTDRVQQWVASGDRLPGIHVSDLLEPRLAYWRAVHPLPLSPRLAGIFFVGRVLHAFCKSMIDQVPLQNLSSDEGSRVDDATGIIWSVDHFIEDKPCEIKTSRALYEPRTLRDLEGYATQLLAYMALSRQSVGKLWVLYINAKDESGRTSPQFRCYTVTASDATLDQYRAQLVAIKQALETAIAQRSPGRLPLCEDWKCGAQKCEYWEQCRPEGRYGKTS